MHNEGWSKHAFAPPSLHSLMLNHHSSTPYHILFHNSSSAQRSPNPSPSSVAARQKHTNPHNSISPMASRALRVVSQLISASLLAPIERVQILMQCQNEMIRSGKLSTPYRGMEDCLLRTIKHEGVLALWRGNSAIFLRTLTTNMFSQMSSPSMSVLMSGLKFLPLSYPWEYARTRLANDVRFRATPESQFYFDASNKSFSNVKYRGVFDVFKKTLKSDGISGLYRGCTVAYVRSMVASIILSKEIAYYQAEKRNKKRATLLAWITTTVMLEVGYYASTYPFWTVSRRMMMTSGEATKYLDPMDAVRHIVKHEGVASLYKGVAPAFIHHCATTGVLLAISYLVKKSNLELKLVK